MPTNDQIKSLYSRAVRGAIAEHIDQRLVSQGCRLTRGTSAQAAEYITRRWSHERVVAFFTLAEAAAYMPKTKLTDATGWNRASVDTFWTQLATIAVPALQSDGDRVLLPLFRRGHEMFFAGSGKESSGGIYLKLNVGPLAFTLAREATESTLGAKVALDQNYRGAADDQASDMSRPEAERTHALRAEADAQTDRVVVGPQTEMFRKASGQ